MRAHIRLTVTLDLEAYTPDPDDLAQQISSAVSRSIAVPPASGPVRVLGLTVTHEVPFVDLSEPS